MVNDLPSLLLPAEVLSVGGLTDYIQSLLELDEQLLQVWVTGEISSASRHRSGMFFTLQDPDTQASIRCVVWTQQLERLVVQPSAGEQIIVLGRIRLYPQRGEYQLLVWQALPAGAGLRALRARQLRDRLAAEGLFDLERKRPLPPHPQTIAVVTSAQAAAWGDIQRTLLSRYPGLRVLLSPAQVQGEQAPASIVTAIRRVIDDGRAEVLLLSRGGGATEDMDCFNDERVVRAISESPIPVIAGIGHQRDESLADLVADVCAHTPTAAAQQAVPDLQDLIVLHHERIQALSNVVADQLWMAQTQLESQHHRLQRIKGQLQRQLSQEAKTLTQLQQRLQLTSRQRLQQQQHHLQGLAQRLQNLDPQAVLQRGYAIVRTIPQKSPSQKSLTQKPQIVRQASQLQPGQELTLQLAKGHAKVTVVEIYPEK
jgi:exodeoxyribonuclease VII large subunit